MPPADPPFSRKREPASFARHQLGVGTVEFALLVPALLLLILMGFDAARYVRATERAQTVADSIAQMLSQTPQASSGVQNAQDGLITQDKLHFFWDSSMFTFPDAQAEAARDGTHWWDLLRVRFASINFLPIDRHCGAACGYGPRVVWGFNGVACNQSFNQVADGDVPALGDLPASVYGPGSIAAVQVDYRFEPTFGAEYLPAMTITRAAYLSPRSVPVIEGDSSVGGNCPNSLQSGN